ncbi:uncharacterized protein LOC131854592 [Achroia grisella]|uniref:uncharacterized protein LOC131854592 n=1 Tax=Achroia grisella TaxID=688607 RepID=UPI0027D29936|nr:uncharacterized protein LOC131854592 [Achroia grisella]
MASQNTAVITLDQLREELHKQTTEISKTIDEKIQPLIIENKELKQEVQSLKVKILEMEKQTRKNNIILHGVTEKEENYTELQELVVETLNKLSVETALQEWDKWELSRVQRLGKKKESKIRPILITLTLTWRRTEILKNKSKFPKNIYVTEDFPKDILLKRKELKIKMKEEIAKGKKAYISYDKLVVNETQKDKRKRSESCSPNAPSTSISHNPQKINKVMDYFNKKPKSISENKQ